VSDLCNICELVIAGPGAGKTTKMINFIEECLPNVAPNRFIAVITYTNEATKEIQYKLKNKIKHPNNLFIGTIHSFLIKFIFEPYAHLFNIVGIDKCYVEKAKELSSEEKNKIEEKRGKVAAKIVEKHICCKKADGMLKHGLVTYDKVVEKSYYLMQNEKICSIVSNRLQYILIDEYQDSREFQHKIFMKILLEGNTYIYAIGDPMQSIFNFTSGISQIKGEKAPKNYNEFPINKFANCCKTKKEFVYSHRPENYRSRPNIVNFINNFNVNFDQEVVRRDNGVPVVFINKTDIEKVIEKFQSLNEKYCIKDEEEINYRINTLMLSSKWKSFKEVGHKYGIVEISNDDYRYSSLFRETLRYILGLVGKSKRQLNKEFGINEIDLRKFVFKIIKDIRLNNYTYENYPDLNEKMTKEFTNYFNINYKLKSNPDLDQENSLKKIIEYNVSQSCNGYYSSIHSAKGLEASSVLVVAERKNLFKKWFLTNEVDFRENVADSYRLGFVGFSRARDFLCIACLEEVLPDLEETLNRFKVVIDPPFKKPQKTFDFFNKDA
jgi:DNA helicase II / ATP-dependent DNA helicase PcrA